MDQGYISAHKIEEIKKEYETQLLEKTVECDEFCDQNK
jgi:hypothetical protein